MKLVDSVQLHKISLREQVVYIVLMVRHLASIDVKVFILSQSDSHRIILPQIKIRFNRT